MCSGVESRVQRKVSVNLKIEQKKLPNMNNTEEKYIVLQGKGKRYEVGKAFKEIIAKNSSTVAINISLQIQGVEQTLNSINPRKFMLRYMIIKLKKIED